MCRHAVSGAASLTYTCVQFIVFSPQITSSAASDLNIRGDGKAIIRGNEGVNIMGRTVEFKMGGGIELRAVSRLRLTRETSPPQ